MNLSRRRFLLGAAALSTAAVSGDAWLVEPRRVATTRHVLGRPQSKGPAIRLVQLSDLHLQRVGAHARQIAKEVAVLAPHAVLITGDAIDRADRLDTLATFLRLLPPRTQKYATLGNWEHWAGVDLRRLARVYDSANARLLVNETVAQAHAGRTVLFTGVDDATAGRPDIERALRDVEPQANHLLLAHSPIYRDQLAGAELGRYPISCMLAGHTHGGQVAPFGRPLVLPPGSGRYVRGWYRGAPLDLYVSRGLGTSVLPVRLGSAPEIAVFDWHLASRRADPSAPALRAPKLHLRLLRLRSGPRTF